MNHVSADHRASVILNGRHRADELAEIASEENVSVVQHLQSVRARLMQLFQVAAEAHDFAAAATISKSLNENAQQIARLTGLLSQAADAASSSPPSSSGDPLALDIASMSTQERQAKMREMIAVALARLSPEQRAAIEASQGDAAPSPAPAPAA